MSRINHPNVIALRAARVLPPGASHAQSVPCTMHVCLWHGQQAVELWRSCDHNLLGADYMLVMSLEGDNTAHMLHQQVCPDPLAGQLGCKQL